jgi:membrane-bound inhibitor of C-type lysozyme
MKTLTTMLIVIAGLTSGASSVLARNEGTIQLKSDGKVERLQVDYDCGGHTKLLVTYVNADPNFLAIVPLPGQSQPLLLASVMSGSGTRYSAGKYIWWTKGGTANLYDTTLGDNASPTMTCAAKR